MANLAQAVGRVGESAIELVGQYETVLDPVIVAIGSLNNIEAGNEALKGAIEEYKSQLEANNDSEEIEKGQEAEQGAQADKKVADVKFNFNRKVFEVEKENK